jgi:S-adenosylmethionine-dependent methyltransferase
VLELRPDHLEANRSVSAIQARLSSGVTGRELDLSVREHANIVAKIRSSIETTFTARGSATPTEDYLQRHSYMRYNRSIGSILPWIGQHIDLPRSEVIEVGCGTGSTLVGLGMNCQQVHGYDIDEAVLEVCATRAQAFGVENISLHLCEPEKLHEEMAARHGKGIVDAILLYAVLEHLSPAERLEAISNSWELLRSDGLLVIVEAPNRLSYFDWHTSQLPFFHQLPLELQRLYFHRSPRSAFVNAMNSALASGGAEHLDTALTRFGQSISYHEFELALGSLAGLVIDDGSHPLVDRVLTAAERIGEDALRSFIETSKAPVPRGFDRANITVILRKPGAGHPPSSLPQVGL